MVTSSSHLFNYELARVRASWSKSGTVSRKVEAYFSCC